MPVEVIAPLLVWWAFSLLGVLAIVVSVDYTKEPTTPLTWGGVILIIMLSPGWLTVLLYYMARPLLEPFGKFLEKPIIKPKEE